MQEANTLQMLISILLQLVPIVAISAILIVLGVNARRYPRNRGWLVPAALVLTVVLVFFLAALVAFIDTMSDYKPLAEELGINLLTWPWPSSFPVSYFVTVLEKGLSPEEVHEIVRDYERVVHCEPNPLWGGMREVYYFRSDLDDNALRMELGYDSEMRLSWSRGEDNNDRRISTSGCVAGILDE
jgi:hypothetical protein